jgi:hypothetical protein
MAKTNDYSIRKQMQDDLIAAYKRVCGHCYTQQQAYERTVKEPAPRYYVSVKRAYQTLLPMMRGDFDRVNLMEPNSRRMYYSLFRKVVELNETKYPNKSLWFIVPFALTSPAPEFFIGWKQCKRIRMWIKNGIILPDGRVDLSRAPSYSKRKELK